MTGGLGICTDYPDQMITLIFNLQNPRSKASPTCIINKAHFVIAFTISLNTMTKLLLAALMLLSCTALRAQTTHADSMTRMAKEDAKKFRLNRNDWLKFSEEQRERSRVAMIYAHSRITRAQRAQSRKAYYVVSSDYFKPTASAVRDTALLKDSIYVQAYRQVAYNKTAGGVSFWGIAAMSAGLAFILLIILFYRN